MTIKKLPRGFSMISAPVTIGSIDGVAMSDRRDPLLVAEELEREYRTGPEIVRVLRGASITVGAGEVVALVGASGVGKSTLLHVLGALDRPSGGRVLFQGEDLFARGEAGDRELLGEARDEVQRPQPDRSRRAQQRHALHRHPVTSVK